MRSSGKNDSHPTGVTCIINIEADIRPECCFAVRERGSDMKLSIFDGYELRALDGDGSPEIGWIWVNYVWKVPDYRPITSELYEFLPFPDEQLEKTGPEDKYVKGTMCVPYIELGGKRLLIQEVWGCFVGRDQDFSAEIVRQIMNAPEANGSRYVDLSALFAEKELEFLSDKEADKVLLTAGMMDMHTGKDSEPGKEESVERILEAEKKAESEISEEISRLQSELKALAEEREQMLRNMEKYHSLLDDQRKLRRMLASIPVCDLEQVAAENKEPVAQIWESRREPHA